MFSVYLCQVVIFGVVQVWVQSSLENVYPDTECPKNATKSVRLYAARGERESFQICIRGKREELEGLSISPRPVDEKIGVPKVWFVGYLSLGYELTRSYPAGKITPDVLLPLEYAKINPNGVNVFWVTYEVPCDAKAGVKQTSIEISGRGIRSVSIAVTLEIFDFTLPEQPTLRTRVVLDRTKVEKFLGIERSDFEKWKEIYQVFYAARLCPSIIQFDTIKNMEENPFDVVISEYGEHLEYLLGQSKPPLVEVSDVVWGTSRLRAPKDPLHQDPLQIYFHDMLDWLTRKPFFGGSYAMPIKPGTRQDWQSVRDEAFRIRRADPRVKRLVEAPLHPFFERYVDIWALPLRSYHPLAWQRLQHGMSLKSEPVYPAARVNASSCGNLEPMDSYSTLPDDAYDGCFFTAWTSQNIPTEKQPEWLEIFLDDVVRTDQVTIGWIPGKEADAIEILTSTEGTIWSGASVTFEKHRPLGVHDFSWTVCRFRMKKSFCGIRFVFLSTERRTTVGVTEVELGVAPDPATIMRFEPVEVWLRLYPTDFPTLYPSVHPLEARIVPWVCYSTKATGVVLGAATNWPREWAQKSDEDITSWVSPNVSEEFLVYPLRDRVVPSIRLERLRDGLEDYEYLQLVPRDEQGKVSEEFSLVFPTGAVISESKRKSSGDLLESPREFFYDQPPSTLDKLREEISQGRIAVGRALDKFSRTARSDSQKSEKRKMLEGCNDRKE